MFFVFKKFKYLRNYSLRTIKFAYLTNFQQNNNINHLLRLTSSIYIQ